ncbi:uncharacterized protein LOC105421170 [Amborella trichopoda]|uniref:uncharacterized protein LOC105421170 n=1 Tax=Amborella trichopoda TaxID=13333 RepID=UPI0005D360C3|nr:uncharacterized protein LOC105421170 [Amborella trichopoda]|eukprot:XP_011625869.1 uncharacterized protein LOC105421170 [Amborella trichopoda]
MNENVWIRFLLTHAQCTSVGDRNPFLLKLVNYERPLRTGNPVESLYFWRSYGGPDLGKDKNRIKWEACSWSRSILGNFSQIKRTQLNAIQEPDRTKESRPFSTSECNLRTQTKLEYFSNLKKEELYWFQRSRVSWLKSGDHNTGFFHIIAKCHIRDNFISTIKVDNRILDQAVEIESAILAFFQNLYTVPSVPRPRMGNLQFQTIPTPSIQWLEHPLSETEILAAINDLGKDKAPGPNGFPIASFKLCWDTFKTDFLSVFDEFFHRGIHHKAINATFSALVLKIEGVEELKDFRPISLVNSSFKILAKVLASRLK